MKIFDSHTHLNDEQLITDIDQYNEHAKKLGVTKLANVGSNRKLNESSLDLAQKYDNMYSIIGWHPEDAIDFNDEQEAWLIKHLTDEKVVALGEIGLDYYQTKSPKDVQKAVFKRQIEIAKQFNLPISVHTREAMEDTFQMLKENHIEEVGGIIHSFNGDVQWMNRFLSLNMVVSYSGVASFKKTKEIHEAAKHTPMDKFLVETDAPYLAPEPLRGNQNEPANTLYTVEAIARYKDINPDEVALASYQNALRVFRIEE